MKPIYKSIFINTTTTINPKDNYNTGCNTTTTKEIKNEKEQ
jgi:hypothetical protein